MPAPTTTATATLSPTIRRRPRARSYASKAARRAAFAAAGSTARCRAARSPSRRDSSAIDGFETSSSRPSALSGAGGLFGLALPGCALLDPRSVLMRSAVMAPPVWLAGMFAKNSATISAPRDQSGTNHALLLADHAGCARGGRPNGTDDFRCRPATYFGALAVTSTSRSIPGQTRALTATTVPAGWIAPANASVWHLPASAKSRTSVI
jgi:hypothetical protein